MSRFSLFIKPRLKLASLMLVLLTILLGCSSSSHRFVTHSDPGGIGGTGKDEGLGGTGQIAQHPGGIGGTGKHSSLKNAGANEGLGGTGIVGKITAFGSIWVNDAHIHFDDQTPITINQSPASSGELQLGQIVAVNANTIDDGYQAQSIDIVHEVVGPLSFSSSTPAPENSGTEARQSAQQNQLKVLKQSIAINENTVFFDTLSNKNLTPDLLVAGAHVEVSGLRQADGAIVASRIDVISPPEQVQVIGELEQRDDGGWQVNDLAIEIDEMLLPDALDKRFLFSGQFNGDYLSVEAVNMDSIETVLEEVGEVIYEGYYFEEEMEGLINVGGLEFVVEDLSEFEHEDYSEDAFRVNAYISEDGEFEAHDLLLERDDEILDFIHDDEHYNEHHDDYEWEEHHWHEEHDEEWHDDEGWSEEDWHEEDDWYDDDHAEDHEEDFEYEDEFDYETEYEDEYE